MGKIDVSVRRTLRALEGHARRSITTGIVNSWNEYKIISVSKWEQLKKKKTSLSILLRYLPEEYLDHPLLYYPGTQDGNHKLDKWYSDWEKYLEEKKNPGLGRFRCASCMLNPDASRFDENFHEIIMKGIDAKFPCSIVNIFQCPYEKDKDELFYLKYIFEQVRTAISHVESTTIENDATHFAYPSRSYEEGVMGLRYNKPNSRGPDSFLGEIELTQVPIRNIPDKFKVLTDRKLLEKVLDEYIEYLRKEKRDKSSDDNKIDLLVKIKPDILRYFSSIKSKISLDKMRDHRGRNADQEKEDEQKLQEMYDRSLQRESNMQQNKIEKRNGFCVNCNAFANILCMECNKWICPKHYDEHKLKIHQK